MSFMSNVKSVQPVELGTDTETSAILSISYVNDDEVSLAAPLNLNHLGLTGGWGYYFAVVANGLGASRQLYLTNSAKAAGVIRGDMHLACWSPDPHSDEWYSIPYQATVDGQLTFASRLPNLDRFALSRTPAYTVTRVYRKTEEYRQHPLVLTTPSAPDGNYGVQTSPLDWRGQPVPDLPLPAYRIGDGVSTGKNIVVLTAGNHPYECHADYNLEGSIDFLLSDDPIAVSIRQWCDIFVYPTVNPAGRWAGYCRSNAELKAAGLDDHNRLWNSGSRSTHNQAKAAFQADFGGQLDVLIDYHTFLFDETSALRGIWAPNEVSNAAFMERYGAREPDEFNNRFAGSISPARSLPEYAIAAMGATVSVHSEEGALASRNVSEYRATGRALMLALYDMINDGLLPYGPV